MDEARFVYVIYIATTVEKLWEALTSPAFTRQYWAGCWQDSDWKLGSPWNLMTPHGRVGDAGEIQEETEAGSAAGNLLARSLFFRLLVHLSRLAGDPARHAAGTPADDGSDSQMADALSYIEENFADPIRLSEAAKLACLSPERYT